MPKKAASANEAMSIPPMNIRQARITLEGDSPLIVHAWSAKAKQEILDKQMKKAKQAKEAKDPDALYEEAFHRCEDGRPGFPAVAFKSAAVDACSQVSDMTKVNARASFHIQGNMIPLDYEKVQRREDMVKIAMGTADVRIRPEFIGWRVTLPIRYNANVISLEQLATLFDVAGFGVGVGEWRPQRDGSNGMFHVTEAVDLSPETSI